MSTDRERETDRQTDRQTDGQTDPSSVFSQGANSSTVSLVPTQVYPNSTGSLSSEYRERERDRERETERQTETDRQTDRQTDRETDRDRQTDRQTDPSSVFSQGANSSTVSLVPTKVYRISTGSLSSEYREKERDRQTERQTDGQTDRQRQTEMSLPTYENRSQSQRRAS